MFGYRHLSVLIARYLGLPKLINAGNRQFIAHRPSTKDEYLKLQNKSKRLLNSIMAPAALKLVSG